MPKPDLHSSLAGIVDIEPPLAPQPAGGNEWLPAGILLLAVMACYLLWRRHTGIAAQSRRHLSRLQRRYLAGQIGGRKAAFALAAILRQQLGVTHLTPTPRSPHKPPLGTDPWAAMVFSRPLLRPTGPLLSPHDTQPACRAEVESQLPCWQTFLDALSAARYAPTPPSRDTLLALFTDAELYCKKGMP